MLTNEQKEELRQAVLRAAVVRAPAALRIKQLWTAVKRDLDYLFEEADVSMACEFWLGLEQPLMTFKHDEAGATKYWRATSAGMLHVERA